LRPLALQHAFEVADVAGFDVAAFDLNDDLLGLACVVVEEVDIAVSLYLLTLLAKESSFVLSFYLMKIVRSAISRLHAD
jgi:hypothetical protein